ncbi:hypothetical protein O3M35_010999 [Rhynocoris fuscipes]|uniref:Uncharacterized protein n=1 Tax=Rhynocoris fuscipes TaxID=488301 RepID=A0AAW1D138_9HEMI
MSRADCYTLIICSLLFAVNIFTDETEASKLPKTWKTCKKSDPKMNECLKGAINDAIHELTLASNPSLGVPIMDPLRLNTLIINQGTGPVSIDLKFTDLDVIGMKTFEVTNVKNDWKLLELEGRWNSLYALDGHYKISGKVLVLPINGEGHCRIDYEKFRVKVQIKMKEVSRKGKQYYEITNFHIDFDVDKVHLNFENLFNGDKALGDNMNLFLNENWREIFNEIKPAISAGFGSAFKEIGNRIFSKITIDEVSPA